MVMVEALSNKVVFFMKKKVPLLQAGLSKKLYY